MDKIAQLKALLAEHPNDAFLQHALALEHVKRGDDQTARQLFETILMEDENYIGSYYQLAQLLERADDKEAAIALYQKGMQKAKAAGEEHAYRELLAAYEELTF